MWLNPPYGTLAPWVNRMREAWSDGTVGAAVVLIRLKRCAQAGAFLSLVAPRALRAGTSSALHSVGRGYKPARLRHCAHRWRPHALT